MENQNQESGPEQQIIKIQVPSADNIAGRRSLVPVLFAAGIIFFFFNFFTISCGGQKFGSVTGMNLVTGTELKSYDMFSGNETKGEKIPSSIWAIFAFGAAVIGLGAFLIKEKREAIIGTGAGIIGAASLIILKFAVNSAMVEKGQGQIACDFQFPYWGALIAVSIAGVISYLRMRKTHNIVLSVSSPQQGMQNSNISQPQVQQVSSSQPQSSFDIGDWFGKNKMPAIGLIILFLVALGVYNFVLKHDPIKDGKKIASATCDCGKTQNEKIVECYKKFISDFSTFNFSGRQAARQKLESLVQSVYKDSRSCYEEKQAKLSKARGRYIGDKDKTGKLEYAYNAQLGLCNYVNEELNNLNNTIATTINQFIGPEEIAAMEKARQDSIAAAIAAAKAIAEAEAANKIAAENAAKAAAQTAAIIQERTNKLIGNWVRKNGGPDREGMVISFDGTVGTLVIVPSKVKGFKKGQTKWRNYNALNNTIEELTASFYGMEYKTYSVNFSDAQNVTISTANYQKQ